MTPQKQMTWGTGNGAQKESVALKQQINKI
jgi:hypothetical protein